MLELGKLARVVCKNLINMMLWGKPVNGQKIARCSMTLACDVGCNWLKYTRMSVIVINIVFIGLIVKLFNVMILFTSILFSFGNSWPKLYLGGGSVMYLFLIILMSMNGKLPFLPINWAIVKLTIRICLRSIVCNQWSTLIGCYKGKGTWISCYFYFMKKLIGWKMEIWCSSISLSLVGTIGMVELTVILLSRII